MLFIPWCFWCADDVDALILLMRRCCWCADVADALMLLMRWCCWCADARGPLVRFDFTDMSYAFVALKWGVRVRGFWKKLCFNCFSFHVSCHNCNPKLLQPFQLLEYQMDRGGGQIWYSREMDLCPPCTEAHPPWRVGLPPRWVSHRGLTHRGGRKDPPHPVGELSDVDCTFTCIYVHILL